jgi:hypothetical protein
MNVRQVLPRDAIPSVDDPTFVDAYDGDPGDRVVALAAGGDEAGDDDRDGDGSAAGRGDADARAYPVRYLHYHEVVNDVAGGVPVAVTWCPLCGSAAVYDRRVGDRTLTFGVSGKLADDDLVLYDRETESEWKQSRGRAIAGPLSGAALRVRPATLTTWERFHAGHPDGRVLAPPGGRSEVAGAGDDPEPVDYDAAPYEAYVAAEGFGLAAHRGDGTGTREWDRTDLDPKTVVCGLERGGEAVGVPLPAVERAGGVLAADVGDESVVVVADAGVHAYEDPGFDRRFRTDGDAGSRELVGDSTVWDGATGAAADGRRLSRVPARRLFAFAWQDDHGPDAFYGLD